MNANRDEMFAELWPKAKASTGDSNASSTIPRMISHLWVGRDQQDATGRELVRIAQAAGELHYDESPAITFMM